MAPTVKNEIPTVLVALGANLPSPVGSPSDTIEEAFRMLTLSGLTVVSVSRSYRTSPFPVADQPDFVNVAASIQTGLSPSELLLCFKRVETKLGRQPGERWSARTLDIDLLAYKGLVLPNQSAWDKVAYSTDPAAYLEEPVVPHPRLHKRAFVLRPLMDIAPDWVHPVFGRSVSDLVTEPDVQAQLGSVIEISAD